MKKGILIVSLTIITLIVVVLGASYAVWNWSFLGEENKISTEGISFEYLESSSEVISINNAIPISDDIGKNLNDTFSFAVTSETSKDTNIEYNLTIEKLDPPAGYTNLSDDQVKVYLTDYDDNVLVGPAKISDLSNYVLYTKENIHNTSTQKIQNKYKLRVWIDESATGIDWNKENKLAYNFKIGVASEEISSDMLSVNVVVKNGTVNGKTKQRVNAGESASFNLVPNTVSSEASVSCDSTSNYTFTNNVLTVTNVTKNTTCTVDYIDEMTTLYEDGTLIINEKLANRSTNIAKHGSVTEVYESMSEENAYVFGEYDVPWLVSYVKQVEIGSKISPVSTAYWFANMVEITTGNFTKLDTSSVTDMNRMFMNAGDDATTFDIGDLSGWDTSNVTNMASMFSSAGYSATTFNIGDLSGWDTSNVTDMANMFSRAGYSATTFNIGDLSGWDTSNVTFMNDMFSVAGKNASWMLDCSGWNVGKVTYYFRFNYDVESKVTPPVWVN